MKIEGRSQCLAVLSTVNQKETCFLGQDCRCLLDPKGSQCIGEINNNKNSNNNTTTKTTTTTTKTTKTTTTITITTTTTTSPRLRKRPRRSTWTRGPTLWWNSACRWTPCRWPSRPPRRRRSWRGSTANQSDQGNEGNTIHRKTHTQTHTDTDTVTQTHILKLILIDWTVFGADVVKQIIIHWAAWK